MRADTPLSYDDAVRLHQAELDVERARAEVEAQRAAMAMASARYQAAVAAYAAVHGGSRRAVADALGLDHSHLCKLLRAHSRRVRTGDS